MSNRKNLNVCDTVYIHVIYIRMPTSFGYVSNWCSCAWELILEIPTPQNDAFWIMIKQTYRNILINFLN